MRTIYLLFIISCMLLLAKKTQAQLQVYHGQKGETQVFDNADIKVSKPILRMRQGEILTVKIVNPNPIFYKYVLKYETINIESDDKAITDILATFNTILAARSAIGAFAPANPTIENYKKAINILIKDINNAKEYIRLSDKPESSPDALDYLKTGGFRLALDKIDTMSSSQFHFNNSNLLNDLNNLSETSGVDDLEKQAFKLLNSSLVEKVNEIKKQTISPSAQTVWTNEFKVPDSTRKIILVISKIDKSNNSLKRDGSGEKDFELEIGTVIPFYKRSTLELVPVASFIFSKNIREFYLENNIVLTRNKVQTLVRPAVILNINFHRFGLSEEMSIGGGIGYKFNSAGNNFENLFLSALFSYKDFLRIGAGFGFAQLPSKELKQGVKVGQSLPSNVSNLNDLIQYEEKPGVFLTVSFTGLNLTKKK